MRMPVNRVMCFNKSDILFIIFCGLKFFDKAIFCL